MPFKNYSITKGGQLTIGQVLSPNFVTGVSGWEIRKDGSAEFNDLTIRGVFMGNDYEINDNGVFFYNGTPAAGNLITSVTNTAGTDPYGNAYPKGTKVYGTGTSAAAYVWLDPDFGRIVIENELSGYQAICDGGSFSMSTPSSTANPSVWSVQDSPLALIIESPSDGTHASFEAKYYAATASVPAYGQTPDLVGLNPSSGSAETWQAMTLGNGWANAGTALHAQYRRVSSPAFSVEIIGEINGGAATNGKFYQLPSGYRPASGQFIPAGSTTLSQAQTWVNCDSSGNLTLDSSVITNRYYFHGFISLDA